LPAGQDRPDWEIVFSESESALTVKHQGELRLELTDQRAMLKAGDFEVRVTSQGGGQIELVAGSSASLLMKKNGDITLKTDGKLKIDATEIALSSAGDMKLKGAKVEVN
jgi:hypothetical protein